MLGVNVLVFMAVLIKYVRLRICIVFDLLNQNQQATI
jgi:hypothetical protein